MAARIEDQIYKFLVDKEDQRCKAIEAENDKHSETRGRKEKRKKVSKPWSRVSDSAICQDIELLQMVTEYDYDLSNESFQEYCTARGVMHVAGEPGSTRWKFIADLGKTKDAYVSNSFFQFAIEANGNRHRYSDEDMAFGWQLMLLARATIQDCWELYSHKAKSIKSG